MNSNIIFLDSTPSLLNEEINEYFAENVKTLINTFMLMKRCRPNIQVNLSTGIFDLKISDDVTLRDIPTSLKHQVKEEIQLLKLNLQKSPYSTGSEDKIDNFLGVDVKYLEISYDSLIWTYLLNSMVLSFNKKKYRWDSEYIQAQLFDINQEVEVHDEIMLRHACNEAHVAKHISWLTEFEDIPELNDFIKEPSNFLSQIRLLDEAKENLKQLLKHYPSIYTILSKVNTDLLNWDQISPLVFSVKNAMGEHQNRRALLKELGYEGYEAHIFFTGNIAGRIHYKIIDKQIEIKYIGKKIGV